MFSSSSDIIELVTTQMSTTASILSNDGMEAAVDTALQELGWVYPITDPSKCLWTVKRAIRHCCFILWVASAQKFKYKQVNLQQRFDHYEKLIKFMDSEYEIAVSEDISTFANVDAYQLFGTAVGPGFRYDVLGKDITYTDLTRFINTGEAL